MKRLLILTLVAMVTASTVGCGCWERFRRGPNCDTCPSNGGPYAPGPISSAPSETYLPAPG
jgi:hypothetical protein